MCMNSIPRLQTTWCTNANKNFPRDAVIPMKAAAGSIGVLFKAFCRCKEQKEKRREADLTRDEQMGYSDEKYRVRGYWRAIS
ncbi:hypothetical protein Agabi119p4_6741 [Agaricus bisporus var. burnettii]|uniref:Uncharacterized protein n=1 Tax=Agaricus bisporus var. burnettii TaxID=192524 RepID=A0A8H7EZY7_AGABI|nr:hypothetical protein Agabi119p4_6741 [Agaricus bisporus var. burnettii]